MTTEEILRACVKADPEREYSVRVEQKYSPQYNQYSLVSCTIEACPGFGGQASHQVCLFGVDDALQGMLDAIKQNRKSKRP